MTANTIQTNSTKKKYKTNNLDINGMKTWLWGHNKIQKKNVEKKI